MFQWLSNGNYERLWREDRRTVFHLFGFVVCIPWNRWIRAARISDRTQNAQVKLLLRFQRMAESLEFEHYQLLTNSDGSLMELGRGAMGVTYKAFDTNLY